MAVRVARVTNTMNLTDFKFFSRPSTANIQLESRVQARRCVFWNIPEVSPDILERRRVAANLLINLVAPAGFEPATKRL